MVELFVFPTSLVAATLMIAFGGRATTVASVALLAAAGLTVCQPFGATVGGEVSSTDLNGSTVIAEGEQVGAALSVPATPNRRLRRRHKVAWRSSPGSSDAKARTWIVPGLLSHAATLSYYDHFDTVRLRRLSDGGLAMELLPGDPNKVRARASLLRDRVLAGRRILARHDRDRLVRRPAASPLAARGRFRASERRRGHVILLAPAGTVVGVSRSHPFNPRSLPVENSAETSEERLDHRVYPTKRRDRRAQGLADGRRATRRSRIAPLWTLGAATLLRKS